MKKKEIENTTSVWELYEKGVNYNRKLNLYTKNDRFNDFYNGDQWEGLQTSGIERIQLNFIKPTVKYKVGTVTQNLFAINYSSVNYDDEEFMNKSEDYCRLLNKKAAITWEKDNFDYKLRTIVKLAAISGESLVYSYYDTKNKTIKNEIVSMTDVCFSNENNENIQEQNYIIIKKREDISKLKEEAREIGVSEEEINKICSDKNVNEEANSYAKEEVEDKTIVLTKLYKKDGKVFYDRVTKSVVLESAIETGLEYYQLSHLLWENVNGYARGIGEVEFLIPNQIELNKTLMRRAIVTKQIAYPQRIINMDYVKNPDEVGRVGSVIKVRGMGLNSVKSAYDTTTVANVTTDAEKIQNTLLTTTRELAGAGEIATGDVDPESASGRAILAVQQASKQPLNEQTSNVKKFIEDLARIWFDLEKVYGGNFEVLVDTTENGVKTFTKEKIPKSIIKKLQINSKIDITPKSAYDKYAQELSLENLFTNEKISFEEYTLSLEDDSTMPKKKLEKIVKKRKEEQEKINQIQQQAAQMEGQAGNAIQGQETISEEQMMNASIGQ